LLVAAGIVAAVVAGCFACVTRNSGDRGSIDGQQTEISAESVRSDEPVVLIRLRWAWHGSKIQYYAEQWNEKRLELVTQGIQKVVPMAKEQK
jgi:hypothetical protein